MDDLDPTILTPGIRKTVLWLREHGFDTCDSGDGVTNVEAGMDCAFTTPNVHIRTTPLKMVSDARSLLSLLEGKKIKVDSGMIQATYDPSDGSAILSLYEVDDSVLVEPQNRHGEKI